MKKTGLALFPFLLERTDINNLKPKNKMKSLRQLSFIGLAIAFALTSCISVEQIGKHNMISNRNIDQKLNYEVIATYTGGSKRELKKTRARTIDEAVDQTVRKVAGGEFLMNVKVYLVTKSLIVIKRKYFAVEGDVWGVKSGGVAYRGFKVGDKVMWKVIGIGNIKEGTIKSFKKGTIKSLKDDKTCLIETESGEIVEKKYDDLSKVE